MYSNVVIGLGKAYIIKGSTNVQSPNRSTCDVLVFKQTVDIQIGTNCASRFSQPILINVCGGILKEVLQKIKGEVSTVANIVRFTFKE